MGAADELKAASQPDAMLDRDRQLIKVRGDYQDLRSKYEAAIAQLNDLEKRNALLTSLSNADRAKPRKPPKREKHGTATAILVLSDWHVEETVEPSKVNGLNEFDLTIAQASIERTFERALLLLEDARHLANIREMVVAVLGDLIAGAIHEELMESNSLAPLPATMFAAEHLETGLRTLLAHGDLDRIVIPTAYGNHGRTTRKPRYATGAENSFEHNLYLHLARRFADDPRVEWQISSGYHNWLDVQGLAVRFHHGDSIQYWGGVGGITIPVNKAIASWNKSRKADLDFFGHFHEFKWDWSWVCNGSLVGYGPFSVRIKAPYQPPLQTFAVIDSDRGLTRVLPIFCR